MEPTEGQITARRTRGGGHAARIARPRARAMRAAFIERAFEPFRMASEESLALIERNADTILAEIGMEFRGDEEVLAILRDAGADVKGERVRFERGMCRRIIQASAPRSFIQHARDPAKSVRIGGNACVLAPAGGAPFVHDLDRGRRYATTRDFHDLMKLSHRLDGLHHADGLLVELMDLPIPERHLEYVPAQFRLTDRPIIGATTSGTRAEDTMAMARIVFGDDFVARNSVVYGGVNTNSPLVLDATMMDSLKVYARAGQAVVVSPYILAGAMGPVGIAGALAQQLAEAMAGLALVQIIRPGTPCTMGVFIGTIAMATGAPAFGTPESLLGITVASELARRLGVPVNCAGGAVTASKIPDAQAAYESALTLHATFLAGANMVWHAAGWLDGGLATGFEKMVLDNDLCTALATFARGLDVSEEGQALDALREIEPGGHFLGTAHTRHTFETALWRPALWDTKTFEQWSEEGARDAAVRANARWKELLRTYEPPPLDPAIDEALVEFIAKRCAAIRAGAA
ncbi:MAG: trimethylamine methyltransferase family protein [Alphaproteobacteria bacterium]|nr:trimethylamine methyltransferase family protein [Alphaproteobacteria bacterium]